MTKELKQLEIEHCTDNSQGQQRPIKFPIYMNTATFDFGNYCILMMCGWDYDNVTMFF